MRLFRTLPARLVLMAVLVFSAGCGSMGGNVVPGECPGNWWKYVYSPERFVIQQACVTVRGVVVGTRYPLDGDAIIYLTLDPEYARFSSKKGYERYGKATLELEIVCRHPVFKFFVSRCWSCHNEIPVPRQVITLKRMAFMSRTFVMGTMNSTP